MTARLRAEVASAARRLAAEGLLFGGSPRTLDGAQQTAVIDAALERGYGAPRPVHATKESSR